MKSFFSNIEYASRFQLFVASLLAVSCTPSGWRAGIHASLAWSQAGLRVVEVAQPGPSARAGLRADDRVVAIDDWSTADRSYDEVIEHLRGPVGSVVTLSVKRGTRTERVEIVREPFHHRS